MVMVVVSGGCWWRASYPNQIPEPLTSQQTAAERSCRERERPGWTGRSFPTTGAWPESDPVLILSWGTIVLLCRQGRPGQESRGLSVNKCWFLLSIVTFPPPLRSMSFCYYFPFVEKVSSETTKNPSSHFLHSVQSF